MPPNPRGLPILNVALPPPELRFQRRMRATASLTLIFLPLLNVLFLLLIFFLLGSTTVSLSGTEVALPEVAEGMSSIADKLVITYTRQRLIAFNDQAVKDFNDLENKLIEAVGRNRLTAVAKGDSRAPVIIIRADRAIPYQELMQLLALTRRHGAKVFLATDTKKP